MDKPLTYSNTHPDVRAHLEEQNARRFDQLNGLVISNAEGAWQFLLAVNGGSAVAVLAFIGAVPTHSSLGPQHRIDTEVVANPDRFQRRNGERSERAVEY